MISSLLLSLKEATIQDSSSLLMIAILERYKNHLVLIPNVFFATMQTQRTAFSATPSAQTLSSRMVSASQPVLLGSFKRQTR